MLRIENGAENRVDLRAIGCGKRALGCGKRAIDYGTSTTCQILNKTAGKITEVVGPTHAIAATFVGFSVYKGYTIGHSFVKLSSISLKFCKDLASTLTQVTPAKSIIKITTIAQNAINKPATMVANTVSGPTKMVANAVSGPTTVVANTVSGATTMVANAASGPTTVVANTVSGATTMVADAVSGATTMVADAVSGATTMVADAVSGPTTMVADAVSGATTMVADAVSGATTMVANTAVGAVKMTGGALKATPRFVATTSCKIITSTLTLSGRAVEQIIQDPLSGTIDALIIGGAAFTAMRAYNNKKYSVARPSALIAAVATALFLAKAYRGVDCGEWTCSFLAKSL